MEPIKCPYYEVFGRGCVNKNHPDASRSHYKYCLGENCKLLEPTIKEGK
jgi:hypothetical protein